MTVRLLVCCDGTPDDRPDMALETCRAFLPTPSATLWAARREAAAAGWTVTTLADPFDRDLCPSCVRAREALDLERLTRPALTPETVQNLTRRDTT